MAQQKADTETPKDSITNREEATLAFWKSAGIFEKTLAQPAPKGDFTFYDGPPFATGLPHYGSLLSSIIKDVIPRYKTMRGYKVRRRWGWDCHGLPIESLVEKKLGLKTKKDILALGIDKFNEMARSMVLQYVTDWKRYIDRVGRWVDFDNAYKTMDNSYIESVWWALKELHKKGKLYEGKKVLMYCPHCETPLAKAEIAMDNTYENVTEEAVTVKFKVKDPKRHGLPENTYLLAWTTTPWTLPGNVALAIGKNISYGLSRKGDEYFITAEALRPDTELVGEAIPAGNLIGMEYEPLFAVPSLTSNTSYKVYAADFVNTEEGTGIVHTAVMYGEDDFELGLREKLPMVQLLTQDGTYNDKAPEFIRGKYLRDAQKDIKADLEKRGLLFARKNHTHSYPHCYRCGTPLIYNAVASWFIDIQSVKSKLLAENEKISWTPSHLKEGRFKHIVETAPDWTISRNRFWASPLPIWKERGGEELMVVGSLEELKRRTKRSGNAYLVMRHGESETNVANRMTSLENDCGGLTEKGREQVRAAAEPLKRRAITKLFSSPLRRTKESAEILAEALGLPMEAIIYDERLREFDFGDFNGKSRSEFLAYGDERMRSLGDSIPGGESLLDAKRRFGAFLYECETKYANESILIMTHGIGLETLTAVVKGADALASKRIIDELGPENAEIIDLEFVPLPVNGDYELDVHRPYIDRITLVDEVGKEYERIPEVVDCWVESGSMPFAEFHYPFAPKGEFEPKPGFFRRAKRYPADFIAEYVAQTRTWFYYLHAMGVLLFGKRAFSGVVSTGTILAADGSKMSKSKGNYTDPLENIEKFGADALRLYLMGSVVMQGEDLRFRDEEMREAYSRIVNIFDNTASFYALYRDQYLGEVRAAASPHVLDRWVQARMAEGTEEMTDALDRYNTPKAVRALRLLVEDVSTWYVRRSRERVKGSDEADKQFALATLSETLRTLAILSAPLAPFIAERVYRAAGGEKESVHLEVWPEKTKPEQSVLLHMGKTRSAVALGLEVRSRERVKVRQPLAKASFPKPLLPEGEEYLALMRDELNVKRIEPLPAGTEVSLDTERTPELIEEGVVREFLRAVQDARKRANLAPGDIAELRLSSVDEQLAEIVRRNTDEITRAAQLSGIKFGTFPGEAVSIEGHDTVLSVERS